MFDELKKYKSCYFYTENGILYNGDCLEIMDKLIENGVKFDAIITDIPYGTTACKWDSIIPFNEMWKRLNKLIKPNDAVVLFGSEPFTSALIMSNVKNFKYDWIWIKNNGTNAFLSKQQPMRRHENILVFGNGKIKYNPQMREGKPYKWKSIRTKGEANGYDKLKEHKEINNNGIRFPITLLEFKQERGLHPTQKPVALMKYLIKTYTNENDLVLDFTCGSGSTLIACENLNRKWIGIKLEEKYCEITKNRILEILKQTKINDFFKEKC